MRVSNLFQYVYLFSVNLHRHAYVEVRGKFEKWVLRIEFRSSSTLTHYLALQRRAMLLLLLLF